MHCNLNGALVLVTRPQEQAAELCRLVQQARGVPVRFASIAIEGPLRNERVMSLIQEMAQYDMAIFVSANAVRYALELAQDAKLPAHIAAVGRATAEALQAKGIEPTCVPQERFDSEALLELPELQAVKDKKIVLFRGKGGRELLAETLIRRGAQVQYADVYRRKPAGTDAAPMLAQWPQIKVVTTTSNEILQHLRNAVGVERLREKPLVVVSERARTLAQEWDIPNVIVATQASNEAIMQAVCSVCGDADAQEDTAS